MTSNTANAVPAGDSAHEVSQDPLATFSTMPYGEEINRAVLVIGKGGYYTLNLALTDRCRAWYNEKEDKRDQILYSMCKYSPLKDGETRHLVDEHETVCVRISRVAKNVYVISVGTRNDDDTDDEDTDDEDEETSDDPE